MPQVLAKAGAAVQEWAMIYKAVFQIVLLYGSEISVLTGVMLPVLEDLHCQLARRIVVRTYWCDRDVRW